MAVFMIQNDDFSFDPLAITHPDNRGMIVSLIPGYQEVDLSMA